eukprot:CAMPEP_0182448144 /NCGR_PEP_ID=MMETSP1172-20130603/24268_1 /TAXON_ID=708627 /ORGANISM="Timspurckia oligopyrenoides, Strain CCMP3278" /LENGTH=583 /DNA_ID=CAMNT_0024644905 /DNA_START=207 /DNA_END=1958 /DNA_ORIENTATION=-
MSSVENVITPSLIIPQRKSHFTQWFTGLESALSADLSLSLASHNLSTETLRIKLTRYPKLLLRFARTSSLHQNHAKAFLLRSEFVEDWSTLTTPLLSKLQPRALCALIYVWARLDTVPSESFCDQWLLQINQKRSFSVLPPSELSAILWSFTKLRRLNVDTNILNDWTQSFLESHREFNPKSLAMSIWGFAVLQVRPSREFFKAWADEFHRQSEFFDNESLCNSIWSISVLDAKPTRQFLDLWMNQLIQNDAELNPQQVSIALWGLAKLKTKPSADFMNYWNSRFIQCRRMDVSDVSLSLWALAELQISANEEVSRAMVRFIGTSSEELETVTQSDFVRLFRSISRGCTRFPKRLMISWCAYFESNHIQSVKLTEWCDVLWSFTRMDYTPSDSTIREFCLQFESRSVTRRKVQQKLSVNRLVRALSSLASMDYVPSGEFLMRWFVLIEKHRERIQARDLCTILWGLARLEVVLPVGAQSVFIVVVTRIQESRLNYVALQHFASCIFHLARLRVLVPRKTLIGWKKRYYSCMKSICTASSKPGKLRNRANERVAMVSSDFDMKWAFLTLEALRNSTEPDQRPND